jgi:hypothetical protein
MEAFVKTRRNRSSRESVETSSTSSEGKQAWPLYSPSDSLPSFTMKIRRSDDGYSSDIPDSSSCDCRSTCSSPLSDVSSSYDSSSCNDFEETIKRAELHSNFYKEASSDEVVVPRAQAVVQVSVSSASDTSSSASGTSSCKPSAKRNSTSPLLLLGSDIMAQVMTFIEPPEILKLLTMPLCKEWQQSYSSHQDLWRMLCLLEPFKAKVGDDADDDDSFCSFSFEPVANNVFGQYRLMYTSFVRCMGYLSRIKEDTRDGKPPSVIEYGRSGFPTFGASKSLKKFLAIMRGVPKNDNVVASAVSGQSAPIGVSDEGYRQEKVCDLKIFNADLVDSSHAVVPSSLIQRPASSPERISNERISKKPKFANSMITQRLLCSSSAQPSHLKLPKSCAIYSLVNWMVAYPDVEGIQTMCVETLPCLLEDEQQRLTAQRVGLTDIVLRAMLRFRDSLKLHTAAFHTMVLLARPLGGREGMLFDNSLAESDSALGSMGNPSSPARAGTPNPPSEPKLNRLNGIAIMIDSMRRFETEAKLQAMACWAMVNLALVPAQKTMIMSLDGIQATVNAMLRHPHSYDVQFRAMFALINLVVPCKVPKRLSRQASGSNFETEKDVLEDSVNEITNLVVIAMKNFCSCETILNRACLVLHNISQSPDYLTQMLWTPHCYQMLEWCIANHPTDQVLRRSAMSTLHRLQVLLSENESLRRRFAESIRAEQELSFQNGADQSQHA